MECKNYVHKYKCEHYNENPENCKTCCYKPEENVEITIKSCRECPCKYHVYEQGFCGDVCRFLPAYQTIPDSGISKYCPLNKGAIIIKKGD